MSIFNFSNSNTAAVQDLVGQVNRCLLRAQDSLVDNHGVTNANINYINQICEELQQLQNQIQRNIDSMSQSKLMDISVPWTDGRYFPLAMWLNFYNMYVARIKQALMDYERF